MSGLEITGAVLGALPLVISAFEHYANGVKTAKRFLRYKPAMSEMVMAIRTEQGIFGNIIAQLLTGIASMQQMDELVSGGSFWQDDDIEIQLRGRLCGAYEIYMENVCGMEASLTRLMEKLALDPDGKPQFTDPRLFREELKRLQFSIKKADYAEDISTLRSYNLALRQLTQQSRDLETTRGTLKQRSCTSFSLLQDHARDLYETLRLGLHCGCGDHAIKLRLESRKKKPYQEDMRGASFRVIFTATADKKADCAVDSKSWPWTEADICYIKEEPKRGPEPPRSAQASPGLRSSKQVRFNQVDARRNDSVVSHTERPGTVNSASGPEQIVDLCTTVATLRGPRQNDCLGYLTDNFKRKYGIYPLDARSDVDQEHLTVYSLRQVLKERQNIRFRLTLTDKLRVAIDLASSVLQLHKTPWLDERWSDKDVFLVHHSGIPRSTLYEHPFVYRKMSGEKTDPAENDAPRLSPYSVIRNQTLFKLGILLVELLFGRSVEELQLPCDLDCEGTPGVAWCTTQRILGERSMEFEAGVGYQDAVRRCIWCDFDCAKTSLDDEALQRAVFEKVVTPLEKILRRFTCLD